MEKVKLAGGLKHEGGTVEVGRPLCWCFRKSAGASGRSHSPSAAVFAGKRYTLVREEITQV
jgi:hypothetical protein